MTEQRKREKVIKALECCLNGCDDECPYWTSPSGSASICMSEMKKDALALLKAQEPIKPGIGILHNEDGSKIYFLHCPIDGTTLDEGDKYCRKCGRAVKWE